MSTTLYAEAEAQLGTRDSRKIGNNTYLERIDAETIGVRLHSTYVIRMTPEYVELDSGGWHTRTTWSRMSDYGLTVGGSKKTGVVVLLREESWSTGGHPYYDGIRLTADGSRVAEDQPSLRPMMGKVLTESGW